MRIGNIGCTNANGAGSQVSLPASSDVSINASELPKGKEKDFPDMPSETKEMAKDSHSSMSRLSMKP
jgi:hypothetical protein